MGTSRSVMYLCMDGQCPHCNQSFSPGKPKHFRKSMVRVSPRKTLATLIPLFLKILENCTPHPGAQIDSHISCIRMTSSSFPYSSEKISAETAANDKESGGSRVDGGGEANSKLRNIWYQGEAELAEGVGGEHPAVNGSHTRFNLFV